MYMFHIALALGLMALVSGVALNRWSACSQVKGGCCGKFVGYIVVILSTLSILCTLNCGYKGWHEGCMRADVTSATAMQDAASSTAATATVEKKKK